MKALVPLLTLAAAGTAYSASFYIGDAAAEAMAVTDAGVVDGANGGTITYREIADLAKVPPPGRIRTVTETLEDMIRADHAKGSPLRAAVAVSRAGDGLPGAGFFQLCREIALYFGPDSGPQAALFHEIQRQRLLEHMDTDALTREESS